MWICADPEGHLQATGRDVKGRKQSRYHPAFRSAQEQTKFDQLVLFGSSLAQLASARSMPAAPANKREFLAAVDHAAGVLGNTRSVCRSSYVHPVVERTWFDGTLVDVWRAGPRRPTAGLATAERRTLHLLQTAAEAAV